MAARAQVVLAALLLAAAPACAQTGAQHAAVDAVRFEAQATREIENDQLVAVLAAEAQGPDAAALADAVNRRMAAALKTAARYPSIRLRSGNYQTVPRYREGGRMDGWQVSQELRLEGADFAAMTRLIGELQRELQVRSMAVRLAPETRRAAEDALVGEAIAAFRARAALVQQAMKARSYRIRSMEIATPGALPPQPLGEMRAYAAAPAVEPGVSRVTVSVSGSVQLD